MVDINIKSIFSDIPPMATERLILRKLLPKDYQDMYEYASNENTVRYLAWESHRTIAFTKNYTKFLQKQYKDGLYYDWAVTLKSSGKMIGTCGFTSLAPEHQRGEIGYVISPEFWGMGIAKEAAEAVIRFGFEQMDLHRIEAKFIVGNDASERVMQKLGMQKDGVFRDYMFVKGLFRDICFYSITAEEYFKNKYNL